MTKVKKSLLIFMGTIFVIIGFIGFILPVMPATPFLLVAGACYIRSSEKLYNKLIQLKYFGPQIKSYVEHREISKKSKILSLLFLWVPTFITVVVIASILKWEWYIRIIPIIIVSLITLHILTLKTNNHIDEKTKEKSQE